MSSPLIGGLHTEPTRLPEDTCPLPDLRLGPRGAVLCTASARLSVSQLAPLHPQDLGCFHLGSIWKRASAASEAPGDAAEVLTCPY